MSLLTRAFASSAFRRPATSRGLEEFFVNQQPGRTGRYWRLAELRLKSFDDLRKLWFVLLKERNMLHTYRFAATRAGVFMKNHERIWKCRVSMRNIQKIVAEREFEHRVLTDPAFVALKEQRYKEALHRKLVKQLKGRRKSLGKFRNKKNEIIPELYKLKPRDPATTPYDPMGGMRHAIYNKMGRLAKPPAPLKGAKNRARTLQRDIDIALGNQPAPAATTATSSAATAGAV